MRCEVCGQEIRGEPRRRIIEGAKIIVCGRCAQFGSGDWFQIQSPKYGNKNKYPSPPRRRQSEVEEAELFEIVEDYGEKIRKAREKVGVTVEELARTINEKESIIKKLEKEEFIPTPKLREKLKRTLGIELMERVEQVSGPISSKPRGLITLGDMIKIKEINEDDEE
jgi:putative transcription factor